MKKILLLSLFLIPVRLQAATQIYIPSTSTFHNYTINIGSGTFNHKLTALEGFISSFAHNAFGTGATKDYIGTRFTSNFTSDGAGGFVAGIDVDPTLIGNVLDTNYLTYLNIAGFGITTNVSPNVVSSVRIAEPQININSGFVPRAASLYIENQPTEGTINAAIMVSTGDIRVINGGVYASSATYNVLVSTSLVVDDLVSTGTWTLNGSIINGTKLDNSTTTVTGRTTYRNIVYVSTGMSTPATFSVNQSSVVVGASGSPATVFGTQTNDNAPVGTYGEFASSYTATAGYNVTTSGVYFDIITTTTFQAGDYDLEADVIYSGNGATFTSTAMELCLGTSPGNSSAGCSDGQNYVYNAALAPNTFSHAPLTIPRWRLTVAAGATQNIYLKGYIQVFTVGNPKVRGGFTWRRVR